MSSETTTPRLAALRRWLTLLIALLAPLTFVPDMARAGAEEAALQAKILLRALAYDRNLKSRVGESVTIGIVHKKSDVAAAAARDQMLQAFQDLAKLTFLSLPMNVKELDLHTAERLRSDIETHGVDILYLCPGLDSALTSILAVSRDKKVATITAQPDYVKQGVSIGVTTTDRAPRLLVNLPASKEEGLSLSAELMRIADVIR